ncbi:MAG TPA: hydroxymethylbilane synthase [Solirubrobacteraceae bacterium]|jgi:hydroxymethylbilane synthase|nr:hydroxymethylbilane synthase [Solirubrobacteraceae bacterium]
MRVGTRGSALALIQARWVAERLGPDAEIVEIVTLGDRGTAISDKSRWVSELERALADARIDVAVHSAKDVPAQLLDGYELVAIPPRLDPRDAVCGAASLDELAHGARVGTSSVRRAAQLHALRPDLEIVRVRGNVDTRLRKLAAGEADALVLALAGLQRLDRADAAGGALDQLVPAAGQGALAVQARADVLTAAQRDTINDEATMACVFAERALVHALDAGCETPVGAWCRMLDDGRAALTAWVGLPDGSEWLRDELSGDPAELGVRCAERMIAAGARELLARAAAQVTVTAAGPVASGTAAEPAS